MARQDDFSARGFVREVSGEQVVFQPRNTRYQFHLQLTNSAAPAASDALVDGLIHVKAVKVWTVPNGGTFVEPITGRPRIIQGRVRWLDHRTLVVQAGTSFVVEMPISEMAVDLAAGVIEVGSMVNVTVQPGATVEFATA